jgi:hypothetical protein
MTTESLRLFLNKHMQKRLIRFRVDGFDCTLTLLGDLHKNKLEVFNAVVESPGTVVTIHFLCKGTSTTAEHVQETVIGLVFVMDEDEEETVICTFVSSHGKRTKLTKPNELFGCIEDMVLT